MAAPRKPRASSRRKKPSSKKQRQAVRIASSPISFGPEICADLAAAEQREWLVTNGIGGFASGTIAGSATRRYHGLLFAALSPPSARTLLVGGVDEAIRINDQALELGTHRWLSGAVAPAGYRSLRGFRLEGTVPIWTYQAGAAQLEKSIWMEHGENTTYVRYRLAESPSPVELELKVLVNYRDFHGSTHSGSPPNDWRMNVEPVEHGARVVAFGGATPFYLRSLAASCEPQHVWYRDFLYLLERERGLDDHEDQLFAVQFRAQLKPDQSITFVFSTSETASMDGEFALAEERARQGKVLAAATSLLQPPPSNDSAPAWLAPLVLAADQFLVRRSLPDQPDGKTVIAGYHWFGDWGRDTMIALPGLALATGRAEIAKENLLAFASFVDRGMLPNNFPDAGGTPEYNTIDAALWYFETIRQYFMATEDVATLKKLFPILVEIIEAHVHGTRYNIHVDADGLLYGGGPGAQLTWMDAKVGDWVVTPRTGKPVEVNALWINALESMATFATALGKAPDLYTQYASAAKSSFGNFWNAERNCCFDVIDAPGVGNDAALRSNQIFAVSLVGNLLSAERRKAVVDVCAEQLLTAVGLRSLAPGEPGYLGRYAGGVRERDAAYHQGTVWGWLLGPFALAHYRVYRERAAALAFLEPLAKSIDRYGLGTLGEISDGDAPHPARGCIAQAWTVGELLRAWYTLSRA
jgi:predicted glycogen debranching enzyme